MQHGTLWPAGACWTRARATCGSCAARTSTSQSAGGATRCSRRGPAVRLAGPRVGVESAVAGAVITKRLAWRGACWSERKHHGSGAAAGATVSVSMRCWSQCTLIIQALKLNNTSADALGPAAARSNTTRRCCASSSTSPSRSSTQWAAWTSARRRSRASCATSPASTSMRARAPPDGLQRLTPASFTLHQIHARTRGSACSTPSAKETGAREPAGSACGAALTAPRPGRPGPAAERAEP